MPFLSLFYVFLQQQNIANGTIFFLIISIKMKRNILELRSEDIDFYKSYYEIKEQIESMGFEWQDWYLHIIYRPIDIVENFRFWYQSERVCNTIVSPQVIIGADHDSIKPESTWLSEFFNQTRNTSTNIKYITTGILKPREGDDAVLLSCYGNRFFICSGRHRVVNGKFLQLEGIPCSVQFYSFSNESYNLYLRLCEIVGKDILTNISFTLNEPVVIQWLNCSFTIPWNENGVTVMEKLIRKVQKIYHNPFLRTYYRLKHHFFVDESCFINIQESYDERIAIKMILKQLQRRHRIG